MNKVADFYTAYWRVLLNAFDVTSMQSNDWINQIGKQLLIDPETLSLEEPWFWILEFLLEESPSIRANSMTWTQLFQLILRCDQHVPRQGDWQDALEDELRSAINELSDNTH